MISKFDYPENLVNDLNSKYRLRLSMPINDKENQLINDAISLLDITSNMVIRLKYYNQYKFSYIAQIINCTISKVRKICHKAIIFISNYIGDIEKINHTILDHEYTILTEEDIKEIARKRGYSYFILRL